MIETIFLVLAFVLALLAALNIGTPRVSLGWAALACYFLGQLLGGLGVHSVR